MFLDSMFKKVKNLWLAKDAGDVVSEEQEKDALSFKCPEGVARRSFLQAMGVTSTTVFLGGASGGIARAANNVGADGLLLNGTNGKGVAFDPWAGSTWKPEGGPKRLIIGEELTIALRDAGINDVADADQLKLRSADVVDSAFSQWFTNEMNRHVGRVFTPSEARRLTEQLTGAAKMVFGADNQHIKLDLRIPVGEEAQRLDRVERYKSTLKGDNGQWLVSLSLASLGKEKLHV